MADRDAQGAGYDAEALRRRYLAERDKRLHQDMEAQYLDASGALARFAADPEADTVPPRASIDREVDALIVGGGFGGLLTAARLVERGVDDFLLIEEGADFGGTWYWNRYPGVRCDIESYVYLPLLEETGTVPSERYAAGAEIFAHCQSIGRRYGLYERALLGTKVDNLHWDEAAARWTVRTSRGDVVRARFVSLSQGPLAKVKLPGLPGIERFGGEMFHSSRWDYDYTGRRLEHLADQRVAVIGTGATAVQIVPPLAEAAEQLLVFQRTPSAIDARNNHATDAEWFRAQPPGWQRRRMENFLSVITGAPVEEDVVGDSWTDFWKRFGAAMKAGGAPPPELMQRVDYEKMEELRARVAVHITDPARAEAMKPWYNYLCKRPLYSDDFFAALNRPNVTLVDTGGRGVEAITSTGVRAGGVDHAVDCIIFATGFDVGAPAHRVGRYEVTGRGGATLSARWEAGPRTLHGTQMSGFPNFHIVGGVAQGTTAFNFTHTLDMQAVHAAELIARCLNEGVLTREVTPEAEDRWLIELEAKHVDHQRFYEECTPGFLNNEGDFKRRPTFVGATYGPGPLAYEQAITRWRREEVEADTRWTLAAETQSERRVAGV